jgi:hypothetical protein
MKRVICLMLAGSAVLAGCGGDDDPAPETPVVTPTTEKTPAISKQDFIEQGDGICAEVNAALGALDSTDAEATAERADLYDGMVDKLRGLGKPDDEAGLDAVLSSGDDLAAAESDAADAADQGDDTALAAAESEASASQAEFAAAASDYGFEECGQGATAPGAAGVTTPGTATAPVAPVTPAPVTPTTPAPSTAAPAPSGGTSEGTSPGAGTAGGGTAGGATGGTSGSGGVGPG